MIKKNNNKIKHKPKVQQNIFYYNVNIQVWV